MEKGAALGRGKTRAPSGMLRIPVDPTGTADPGIGKGQLSQQRKGSGAVDSRRQTLSRAMGGLQGGRQWLVRHWSGRGGVRGDVGSFGEKPLRPRARYRQGVWCGKLCSLEFEKPSESEVGF